MMNLFSTDSNTSSKKSFKESKTFEERFAESSRMLERFPERVPIIVERGNCSITEIDKKKFLVPKDLSIGQFMHVIRKRIKLDSSTAIYLFVNNTLPRSSDLIINEYNNKRDKDGFLYVTYAGESTFG